MGTATRTDLEAYLTRIDVPDTGAADLPTLRRIVDGHARTVTFENLDAFTGRTPDLDPAALVAKLVAGGRGGWCFEQNLLLWAALDEIGYQTTGLAARVLWRRPDDAPMPPRGHMLLRVELPEGPHVVDVGFGGLTLTGVLALEPEREQATPHEPFRLWPDRDGYRMQALLDGAWSTLYRFDLAEQELADYDLTNWYLANHPDSPFVNSLMVARPDVDRRYALNGRALTVYPLDGPPERRELDSPDAVRAVLADQFRLDLSGLPGLDRALHRLW
jgi:N-hydroxyarylamine O-acetyltransferase